jgi:diguanylate cyclase (GGDEF)-like protein
MLDGTRPSRPPLVLIANDQEWSARSLESILGPHGYAVLRAYTGRQAVELARNAQPDAFIVDAGMPDIDGTEVCRLLREEGSCSVAMPIVITTAGPAGRAQRIEAYRAGAWEFCSQPLDGDALLLRLDTWIQSKREVDRVRDQSLLDEITGLYNVNGLARRARELGGEAFRQHAPLACVALSPADEDASPYTDKVVDALAARVAEHLAKVLGDTGRVSDAIGRLGRNEFAIIAPSTEAKGAQRLVQRLQEALEAKPFSVDGEQRTVKLRAGYSWVPDFAEASVDAVELLLRAAAALRHVKASRTTVPVKAFEDLPMKFVQ